MEADRDNSGLMIPFKALLLYTEADFSRDQYEKLSRFDFGRQILPSYSILEKEIQTCCPPKKSYNITNTSCEVKLQDLLNHTVTRLLTYLEDTLSLLNEEVLETLQLVCKWGCHKLYDDATDSIIYHTSVVPINLIGFCGDKKEEIWKNPAPSSTRYCRPIRIKIMRKQKNIMVKEINNIEKQIESLQNCTFSKDGLTANVKVNMVLSKIDADICNDVSDILATKCYICGATSQEFNNVDVKMNGATENLPYGLSSRHVSIRFFASILDLAYKLPVKKSQITTAAVGEVMAKRKTALKESLKREMDITLGALDSGFDNADDDIRSGIFFSDPEKAAEITGVDFNLINDVKIILEIISCDRHVNFEKFIPYCLETAKLYVSLYSWMPMTLTMHTILTHTELVMEKVILPIGRVSGKLVEALRSSDKYLREEDCYLDVFNRQMLMSDPYIASITPRRKRLSHAISTKAKEMLLEEVVGCDSDGSDDED